MTSKETKLRKAVVAQLRDIAKLVNNGKLGKYEAQDNYFSLNVELHKLGGVGIGLYITADILT